MASEVRRLFLLQDAMRDYEQNCMSGALAVTNMRLIWICHKDAKINLSESCLLYHSECFSSSESHQASDLGV